MMGVVVGKIEKEKKNLARQIFLGGLMWTLNKALMQ